MEYADCLLIWGVRTFFQTKLAEKCTDGWERAVVVFATEIVGGETGGGGGDGVGP